MRTSHLKSITTQLNPFSPYSKVPRLLLAMLPPNAHKSIQITNKQVPRTSAVPASLELAFNDGRVMKWEWQGKPTDTKVVKQEGFIELRDIVEEVNRHTRKLGRKEELAG